MKYKGYEIEVCVAVCRKDTDYIIAEFDTISKARKVYSEYEYDFWYLAAEIIDKDGNVNIPCWGKTRQEAINKLKSVL